jgi:hypothetical protein
VLDPGTYASPPSEFKLGTTSEGHPFVLYRDRSACAAMFAIIWTATWTLGCVLLTIDVLRDAFRSRWSSSAIWLFPLWTIDLSFRHLGVVTGFSRLPTKITIQPDQLIVEKGNAREGSRRSIPKAEIQSLHVLEVREEGEMLVKSTWRLSLSGRESGEIFAGASGVATYWLGHLLADWAHVPLTTEEPILRQIP